MREKHARTETIGLVPFDLHVSQMTFNVLRQMNRTTPDIRCSSGRHAHQHDITVALASIRWSQKIKETKRIYDIRGSFTKSAQILPAQWWSAKDQAPTQGRGPGGYFRAFGISGCFLFSLPFAPTSSSSFVFDVTPSLSRNTLVLCATECSTECSRVLQDMLVKASWRSVTLFVRLPI